MVGKIHLPGVPGDQRVEMGDIIAPLGPENPPEALGFFLAAPEGPGDLDHDVGVGQVDGEVAHLREDQAAELAPAELVVEDLTLGVRGLAGDQGDIEAFGDPGTSMK